jgi:hypothetical protein
MNQIQIKYQKGEGGDWESEMYHLFSRRHYATTGIKLKVQKIQISPMLFELSGKGVGKEKGEKGKRE